MKAIENNGMGASFGYIKLYIQESYEFAMLKVLVPFVVNITNVSECKLFQIMNGRRGKRKTSAPRQRVLSVLYLFLLFFFMCIASCSIAIKNIAGGTIIRKLGRTKQSVAPVIPAMNILRLLNFFLSLIRVKNEIVVNVVSSTVECGIAIQKINPL